MQTGLSLVCLVLLCSALGEAALRKTKKQAVVTDTGNSAKSDPEPVPIKTKGLKTLDRGWGEEIEWVQTYEEGLAKARENNKPLMVIHHLEDCPYSIALKKAFVADRLAQKLAREDFIMLNLVHPVADENQAPDGHYVPRVIFVDPSLTVRSDLKGRYGNKMYAYDADDIPECE
ncbi:hypothetical protein XENTR_v10024485 [Xenopus tropicalis]|nr:hypothetical protein XENTR_v10024485 [Xenopus tropicalis]